MASAVEVAIFIETNLGTRMALAVSPDIKVRDFKRELERTHLSCFPESGEIKVYGLMVKQRSCFYQLSKSMPIKYAFQGHKGTRFLWAEASILNGSVMPGLSSRSVADVGDDTCNGCYTDFLVEDTGEKSMLRKGEKKRKKTSLLPKETKKKKRKLKKGFSSAESKVESVTERNSSSMVENSTRSDSAAVSVTNIINRYFSNCSEMSTLATSPCADVFTEAAQSHPEEQLRTRRDGHHSSRQNDVMPESRVRMPKNELSLLSPATQLGIRRDKFPRTYVGERLLIASDNIRCSAGNQRFRYRKLLHCNPSESLANKFMAFEISDNDD